MKNSKATVIVLNWNGKKFLEANINSILNQSYSNFDILVVDNASSDDSVRYIQGLSNKFKKIKLLSLNKNLGFTGGNNAGIRRVIKEGKSEFVVLLNNDVKVHPNWLECLLKGFNFPNIGITTSKILFYFPYEKITLIPRGDVILKGINIGNQIYHCLVFNEGFTNNGSLLFFPFKLKSGKKYDIAVPCDTLKGNLQELSLEFIGDGISVITQHKKLKMKKSGKAVFKVSCEYVINTAGSNFNKKKMVFQERNMYEFNRDLPTTIVDSACGASMAIRINLLKKFGLLDDRFYMYFEDTELSYRFNKGGYRTLFVNDSICYHWFWGSSGGKITENQAYYNTRNRLLFIWKNISDPKMICEKSEVLF